MDLLIGIALALITLLALVLAWSQWNEVLDDIRQASPGGRALFGVFMTVLVIFVMLDAAHEAGERFGWWEERQGDCTFTTNYDAGDKPIGYVSVCPVER